MSHDLWFQEAIKLHENGDIDAAEKIYRQLLEIAPSNPDLLNLLGLIAQAKHIHVEAINLFYEAIKQSPKHPPIHFNLAVSLRAWGKPFEAIDAFQRVIELEPSMYEAYAGTAQIYIDLSQKEKALEFLKKAVEINPDFAEAQANIAYLECNKNKLEEIKSKYPKDPAAFFFLSRFYQKDKEYQKALENILNIYDANDIVYLQMGNLYSLLENNLEAKKAYKNALLQNPSLVDAMINLANIESKDKNTQEAERLYKKAIEIEPKNVNAHINYGNLLYSEKLGTLALEEYRKAVIINPDLPEISNNIGIILRDMKEYEEALGLFFNALNKKQESEEYALNIAETLLLLSYSGGKDKALKISANWIKAMPDNIYAQHASYSLKGKENPNMEQYSKKFFDLFAKSYESTLKKIEYSLIDKIKELEIDFSGTIIDIGCGTGLIGEKIKTNKNTLTGVDISPKMLEIAKIKGIYDNLVEKDAVSYLEEKPNFDWLIALDTLGYIKHIETIIELCIGKKLCFSVELLEDESKNYKIFETGRYKHNPNYITKLLTKHGFKNISQYPIDLRLENNQTVKAILFVVNS